MEENPEAILTGTETATDEGATLTAGETATAEEATLTAGETTGESGATTSGQETTKPEEVREPRENVDHWEDHTFENNVTIAGTLRTKRWVHPHGAMFQTPGKLLAEYPSPTPGMWAIVGTDFPGQIWYCTEAGTWESQGRVVAETVDRGKWKAGERYYAGDLNAEGVYEVSYVWYRGCKYRCLKTGTTGAPLWNSADWEFAEGDPDLHVDFTDERTTVMQADPSARLEVTARLYNQDVTNETQMRWTWERESWRGTTRDTAADTLWNSQHATGTNAVDLTAADMNFQFGEKPDKLLFRVTGTLLTAEGVPATDAEGNAVRQAAEFSI